MQRVKKVRYQQYKIAYNAMARGDTGSAAMIKQCQHFVVLAQLYHSC
jgi:hypothetical protein